MFKKIILIGCILAAGVTSLSAKDMVPGERNSPPVLINMNPDPNGEPWMAGGFTITPQYLRRLANLPTLDLSQHRSALPTSVDNSSKKYFRPIFSQGNAGSCAQASGIGYQLTYEINWKNDTDAKTTQANQLPPQYTHSFVNNGDLNVGSDSPTGWDITNSIGCPNIPDYGAGVATEGDPTDTKWMSGYSKYYAGMSRKVPMIKKIPINTPEGLTNLKQWLYDHGNGSAKGGGIANFTAFVTPMDTVKFASGTPQAGKLAIIGWEKTQNGGHAMTFVGYDDSVRWDYNNDKKYENPTDMKKWEIGALIMANSWGTSFGDKGFSYVMYRTCALDQPEGGLSSTYASVIDGRSDYKPLLTYKVKIKYSQRNDIALSAGLSTNGSDAKPEFILNFAAFNYQGGALKMGGKAATFPDEIEIGLDVTPLVKYMNSQSNTFFLVVDAISGGLGQVTSFSVLDYRGGATPVETPSTAQNVAIQKGTNLIKVNYTSTISDLAITTTELKKFSVNQDYSDKLAATGGKSPYTWSVNDKLYTENTLSEPYPAITDNILKPNGEDDAIVTQDLPFAFPFYGKKYSKVSVSTDGSLLFDPYFEYLRSNSSLPRITAITPMGGDFIFYTSKPNDNIYYKGDAKSATFRWKTTSMWGPTDTISVNFDFAVTLFPNGEFKLYYNGKQTADKILAQGFSAGTSQDYYFLKYKSTTEIPANLSLGFSPFKMPAGLVLGTDGSLSGKITENKDSCQIQFVCKDTDGNIRVKNLQLRNNATGIINSTKFATAPSLAYSTAQGVLRFKYWLPRTSAVELFLLDVAGKRVSTLVKGTCQAGDNLCSVSLKNIAPGTYIAKLTVNGTSAVKRMIVIK